uniref:KIND domain-containing protein n=1 Tax=Heterorhabditis bacteriophora TaxID=37862 RepID=A0A1I7XIZ1_HETBA
MKVASVPDIKVSIAEVCEVRGCGLDAVELLSLAVSAAESLPPCPKGTVFDTENVFISSKGNVQIVTVPQTSVHISFIPPEWAKGDYDEGAAAVYCMGAVMRAAGAEQASDVDLFSLVNILTVAMVGTRPTAHRMGLMARYTKYIFLLLQDSSKFKWNLDATASTSSYHSSEKGTSHCIDVHMDIMEGNKNSDVLLPVSSPRIVNSPFHDSFDTLGSPVGNSTRFNETYIEEQTLDISFNKSFDNNFIDLTTISNPRSKANCESNNTNLTPFDEDENDHGGTLSGRDPFEDEMPFITEHNKISQKSLFDTKEIQNIPTAEFRDFSYLTHQSNVHRLSSSDDEIVQVVVDDDVEPKRSTKSRYFDEISKNISYPHQSCKVSNKNKLIEEASELEDETDNRKHVDAIVITDTHEPEMKSMHTTEYEETPIDTAFDDAIKERLNSQGIEKTIVDPVPPDNNSGFLF